MLFVAAALFVASVVAATQITRKALGELSTEDKAKVVDLAAKTSLVWFVVMMGIVAVWLFVLLRRPEVAAVGTSLVLLVFLALSGVAAFAAYRRYRSAGLPLRFAKSILLARALRLAGAALLFGAVAAWLITGRGAG